MIAPKTWPERFDKIPAMRPQQIMRIPHEGCKRSPGQHCFAGMKLRRFGQAHAIPISVIHNKIRQELWVVKL